jgi:hypothetical protein
MSINQTKAALRATATLPEKLDLLTWIGLSTDDAQLFRYTENVRWMLVRFHRGKQ